MASKKLWSDKKEGFKKKLHSWTVMVFSYTNNINWMKSSKLSKFHSSELSKFHTKIGVSTIEIDFCLLIFSSEKILEKRLFRELLWCWRSFTFRVDKLIWQSEWEHYQRLVRGCRLCKLGLNFTYRYRNHLFIQYFLIYSHVSAGGEFFENL